MATRKATAAKSTAAKTTTKAPARKAPAKKAPAKASSAAETKLKAQNAELKARIKVLEKALKDTVKNINKVIG